jgi:hypothetical protein
MRNRLASVMAVALLATSMTSFSNSASALPAADGTAIKNSTASSVESVHWRGRGWGLGAAVLGGAIIGGALASPYYGYGPGPYYGGPGPYYYGPGPYAPAYGPGPYGPPPGDAVAYCMERFKSYDPRSGTYLGYDGYRHACP